MTKRSSRPLFLLGVMAVLVGLLALPAAADPPNVETITDEFDAPNPCLGVVEPHTITFTSADHFHENNVVLKDSDRQGFTASGFLLVRGRFNLVETETGVMAKLKDVWQHPDTHETFQAVGTLRIVGNAPVIEEFILECLTGPTILP